MFSVSACDGGRAAALSSDYSPCSRFTSHSREAAEYKPIMDNKHITAQRAALQLIPDFNCFWDARRTLNVSDWSDVAWSVWHQTSDDCVPANKNMLQEWFANVPINIISECSLNIQNTQFFILKTLREHCGNVTFECSFSNKRFHV